jgi:OOP family OmpA-OmpF porin
MGSVVNDMLRKLKIFSICSLLIVPVSESLSAQPQDSPTAQAATTVYGSPPGDLTGMTDGPEIDGFISARSGDKVQVTSADGSKTVIFISEGTAIRGGTGLFGGNRKETGKSSLINGLPVTVRTAQWGDGLVARQIRFRTKDHKIASMIQSGTAQRFDEQAAATEALRGRMADIDKYNIKSTAYVYFETGKSVLSAQAKADLCATAAEADATENALILVVGYTDSTGSPEYNQVLSERRAGRVVNYLQQACSWKPYRMLTPTGMAEADPLASNYTPDGKAQNRRVAVNILVSKGIDGL